MLPTSALQRQSRTVFDLKTAVLSRLVEIKPLTQRALVEGVGGGGEDGADWALGSKPGALLPLFSPAPCWPGRGHGGGEGAGETERDRPRERLSPHKPPALHGKTRHQIKRYDTAAKPRFWRCTILQVFSSTLIWHTGFY